jgi:Zinc knuckle
MPYNQRQYRGNNTYTNTVNMQEAYSNATNTQEQTYQCQRPKGPCFNCGKMGHFAKECHGNPSSNISYMDAEDDNMQNVPQPNITP